MGKKISQTNASTTLQKNVNCGDIPQVSVIVGVRNSELTIESCIESLLSLSSHSPKHEIIIVDNDSTDKTLNIIKRFKGIKILSEQKRGVSSARNLGLKHAQGEVIAFTDGDCVVTPDWLIEGIKFMSSNAIVAGKILGNKPENPVQEWANERNFLDQEWVLNHPFLPSAHTANVFFWKKDLIEIGGFDPDLLSNQDSDVCWKILNKTGTEICYAPKSIVFHNHRDTVISLMKQSKKRSEANSFLAKRWTDFPKKKMSTSIWECYDILRYLGRYLRCLITEKDKKRILFAKYDFLDRVARKYGTIVGAIKTRQWSRW